jgi:hypothetical protein
MKAKDMKTDDLIQSLSETAQPVRKGRATITFIAAALAALAVCVGIVLLSGQVRADFSEHMTAVLAKAAFSGLLVLATAPAMLWLVHPGRSAGLWIAIGVAVTAVAIVVGVLAVMAGRGELAAALGAGGRPVVFVLIPLLAMPAGWVFFTWGRRYAPTRLALSGAAAGALSGGIAAASYALVCPVDEAMFVATWYTASVVLCGLIGAALGRILLRW